METLSVLRGLVLGGKLSEDRADGVRRDLSGLRIRRYPLAGVADRVWELRHALTT